MARVLSFDRPTSFRRRSPVTQIRLTLTTLIDDLHVLAADRPRAIDVFAIVAHRMAAPIREHRRKLTRRSRPMKRTTSWLLVFTLSAAPVAAAPLPFSTERIDHAIAASGGFIQAACDTSRATGRNDAGQRHGRKGWFFGGLGAGLAATFIGAGAITAGAAFTDPQPKEIPANVEEPCYRDGYRSAAKGKNVTSALFGGLIGSVVWILAYSAAVGD